MAAPVELGTELGIHLGTELELGVQLGTELGVQLGGTAMSTRSPGPPITPRDRCGRDWPGHGQAAVPARPVRKGSTSSECSLRTDTPEPRGPMKGSWNRGAG